MLLEARSAGKIGRRRGDYCAAVPIIIPELNPQDGQTEVILFWDWEQAARRSFLSKSFLEKAPIKKIIFLISA